MRLNQHALLKMVLWGVLFILGCPSQGANSAKPTPVALKPIAPNAAPMVSLPALNLTGLDATQKAFLSKLAADEICPCGCPKTLAGCLQDETTCKPAVLMASWVVERLKEGVPSNVLAEAVAREIGSGFAAKQVSLTGPAYAKKGAKNPKITVVEFADFECGHCAFASRTIHDLVKKHPNDVQVIFKHYPLPSHKMAQKAAQAAEAAGKQGRFWEMHDVLFATQARLSDDLILGHAKAIGLNVAKFKKDWVSSDTISLVGKSEQEGKSLKLEGTPSFFINGRPYNLSFDKSGFELRMAMEEARSSTTCH